MKAFQKLLPEIPTMIQFRPYLLVIGPFLTVFLVHYAAANAYASFCTPLSLWGLVQSLLLTASPICSALLTVVNNSNNSYGLIVTGIVSGFLTKLALQSQS
jgi:hypothetical protein